MRLCLTAVLSSVLLAAFSSSAFAELRIDVDKSSQRMSVTVDGQPRYTWPVSTGISSYDTPSGSYKPFRMEATHFSREWDNAPMPHAVFFTKIGHAIHGTNQVRNLGRAASHGCVRLSPGNAATLFSLIKAQGMANTRITVDGAVSTAVAEDTRGSYGSRSARQRRASGKSGYVATGMPAGRERAIRYGYAPQPRQQQYWDPFGGTPYGDGQEY